MTKKSYPLPPGCVLRKANYSDTFHLIQKHLKKLKLFHIMMALPNILLSILCLLLAFLDLSFIWLFFLCLIVTFIELLLPELIWAMLSISRCWVIECNGCLVAYTELRINKKYSSINSLFVESAWRKKGLASCLINRLIQEAPKPTYLRPIYLICEKDLVRFYARFGFVSIPREELPKYLILWRWLLLGSNYSIIRYR